VSGTPAPYVPFAAVARIPERTFIAQQGLPLLDSQREIRGSRVTIGPNFTQSMSPRRRQSHDHKPGSSAHAFIFHGGTVVLKVDDKEVAGNTMERSIALILQWTRTSTSAQSSDGRISQDTGDNDATSIRYFGDSANSPSIGVVFERSARWLVRPSGSRARR
jgi:hypothetical protein